MNKPQTPEEILHGVGENNGCIELSKHTVIETIKEAQRQAVHYALEKLQEDETCSLIISQIGTDYTATDAEIKELESQILKDLGHEKII